MITIHAYDRVYLDSAMDTMGAMMDCAVHCFGMDLERFFGHFLSSEVSHEFEKGNPRHIAGLSGPELAMQILRDAEGLYEKSRKNRTRFGLEYWTGWSLCLLQWETGETFRDLQNNGMGISTIMALYPTLHEADTQKFLDIAKVRIERAKADRPPILKILRKASGLTQAELADRSGVSLRAIQSYEQRYLDISKADARCVRNLARVLHCRMEDLLQN